ncbi:MAG TPA: oligopeptide/dipeptide ABC transporter ATP-binding protein, partial [Galbitalea sp.]
LVMYAGRVIESGPVDVIFNAPRHPYTWALLACRPRLEARTERLASIPGRPPELTAIPSGCPFHPRCPLGADKTICAEETPQLRPVGDSHHAACHFAEAVIQLDHANGEREAAVAK